jgi:hypothetical protein
MATPVIVLSEGFDDIGTLSTWSVANLSTPPGLDWFQGNPGVFPAYAGAPDSYTAVNFLSAQGGAGFIDNWLLTPELTLQGPSSLSFYTRAACAGFLDTLEVRFGANGNFDTLLGTIGGGAYPTDWQNFSANIDFTGTGRFAFRYIGDAASANYIGLDSVLVTSVPEPSVNLLLAAGVLLLVGLRRRRIG